MQRTCCVSFHHEGAEYSNTAMGESLFDVAAKARLNHDLAQWEHILNTRSMAQSPHERIEQALKLEELQRNKAIIQFNRECDTEITEVISNHAALGVLQSSATATKIMQAHAHEPKGSLTK